MVRAAGIHANTFVECDVGRGVVAHGDVHRDITWTMDRVDALIRCGSSQRTVSCGESATELIAFARQI